MENSNTPDGVPEEWVEATKLADAALVRYSSLPEDTKRALHTYVLDQASRLLKPRDEIREELREKPELLEAFVWMVRINDLCLRELIRTNVELFLLQRRLDKKEG